MNALFFVFSALFFIILQTIFLPSFSWFAQCFDQVTIFIIYLSLIYPRHFIVPGIVLMGLIMDSISGCALFSHVFSYTWIYIIIRLFRRFVFQKSIVFVLMISMVSAVIHQALIFFSIVIIQGSVSRSDFSLLLEQILWALLVIPAGLALLNWAREIWLSLSGNMKKQLIQRLED